MYHSFIFSLSAFRAHIVFCLMCLNITFFSTSSIYAHCNFNDVWMSASKACKEKFSKEELKNVDAICGHIKLFYSWHEYFCVLNIVGNSIQICDWKICLIIIFTSRSEAFKLKALYHLNILIYLFKCVVLTIKKMSYEFSSWLSSTICLTDWVKCWWKTREVKVCAMQTKPEIQKFHSIFFFIFFLFFISSNMR